MDLSGQFEQFHRKRWFPEIYPDPFGELIDSINEQTISELASNWEQTTNPRWIYLARGILDLLPQVLYVEIFKDLQLVYQDRLTSNVRPQYLYYYLRSLPETERQELWTSIREWCTRSRNVLAEWHHKVLSIETRHAELNKKFDSVIGLNRDQMISELEQWLTTTRELFEWELRRLGTDLHLPRVLANFRFKDWDDLFDWNAFPSLAKNFSDTVRAKKVPLLKRSLSDDAVQFVFPVNPPNRVIVEYGKAAGPIDALRCAAEYMKGCYYKGMNPGLSPEFRIAGDPSIAHFWAFLFASQLARKPGIRRLIGAGAEDLAPKFKLYLELWSRIDAARAIYRHRIGPDLKESRDLYVANRELALPGDDSYFLDLFDLDNAAGALYRVRAAESALAVNDKFLSLYGNEWFASDRCGARIRDYWYEGTTLTLPGLLADLHVSRESFNWNWSRQ
jgi:hypothetical protein